MLWIGAFYVNMWSGVGFVCDASLSPGEPAYYLNCYILLLYHTLFEENCSERMVSHMFALQLCHIIMCVQIFKYNEYNF